MGLSSLPDDRQEPESGKVTRRGFIKWTTALVAGGAALVGLGAGYGADLLTRPTTEKTVTTTVTAPVTTLSYKPPLSPQIQTRVDSIVQQAVASHQGESTVYANCEINCGGNNACILKLRVKNGVLVGVEPDDTINAGVGREDSVLLDQDLQNGVLQFRPCQRGYSWAAYVNSPDRITYPMKRTGVRGEGAFVRVSWTEALDSVANMIKETYNKYGPYSIGWPYNSMLYAAPSSAYTAYGFTGNVPITFLSHFGVGTTTWGDPSTDMRLAASTFMAGTYVDAFGAFSPPTIGDIDPWSGLSRPIADIFSAKFILLWGVDPTSTSQFLGPYYLRMAREKHIPVVSIDPRYTKTAEVLSDQWIPIRPGTDTALILGICNVMFTEGTYDAGFVSNNVEPTGFAKWKDYVTGVSDGVPKTPQWAETICGVPSETTIDLTHKLVANKPVAISWFNSPGRIPYGENQCRAEVALQAMLGSVVMSRDLPGWVSVTGVNLYGESPTYVAPQLYHDQGLFKAIVERADLDSGKITQDEYFARIGNAKGNPSPNIKMVFHTFGNALNTSMNTNRSIAAVKMLDYFVVTAFHQTTTTSYADMILPISNAFEGGFRGLWSPYPAAILLGDKATDRPGEVMDHEWVYAQLASRLGVLQKYNPNYTTDAEWESMWDGLLSNAWSATAQANGITTDWATFKQKGVYRLPSSSSILAPKGQSYSFSTPSSKLEIWSKAIEDKDTASYPAPFTNMDLHGYNPVYDPSSLPEWVPAWEGFWDPKVRQYPLTLVTPHSRFRAHTCFDSNPLLNGDCYRHSIWLSVADATKRNVSDGDLVRVFNDVGEMVMPAYVTSKMVPGAVCIYKGANYTPNSVSSPLDPDGIDRRGGENILTSGRDNPMVPPAVSGLVEVEKF